MFCAACQSCFVHPQFAHQRFGGIMPTIGLRSLRFGLMLATALSVSILPTTSEAYTQEQQAACTDDAFRICSSEIPDVDRVTACMVRNQSQLSPGW